MPTKTKKQNKQLESLSRTAQQAGIMLMTAAVTLGMLELPDKPNSRVVVPSRPAFAFAENGSEENVNPVRREREETGPHYISYSVSQRTPSRSGKR